MSRPLRLLVALAMVALLSEGCSSGSSAGTGTGTGSSGGNNTGTNLEQAVKFAACMRENGVREFPDPDASGNLTIDQVANGSSLDTNSASFKQAMSACKDLEPAGFTGTERSAEQQKAALNFAQCMRDNGVKDFPDPNPDGPLIAVNGAHSIPGFQAAGAKCLAVYSGALGFSK
jgi:hypothetical protein